MSLRYSQVLPLCLVVIAASCSDRATAPVPDALFNKGTGGGVPVAFVVVTPSTNVLRAGWQQQLTAQAFDANGSPIAGVTFRWKTSNPATATISKTGIVTGISASGTASILAQTGTKHPSSGGSSVTVLSNASALVAGGQGGSFGESCALGASGVTSCWGNDEWGQLGRGAPTATPETPSAIAGGQVFASIVGGYGQNCGLTMAGSAYCWGSNGSGELGTGAPPSYGAEYTPQPVAGGIGFSSLAASSRASHNCGLTASGLAWCWGFNANGQLGDNTTSSRNVPTAVQQGTLRFVSLAVGGAHTCGLTASGRAYCWGYNDPASLGTGAGPGNFLTPQAVSQGTLRFVSVSLGRFSSCALTTVGIGYCWGTGPMDGAVPVPILGNHTFTSLVAGDWHTCGLDVGGEAYCFGLNASGQLGDGTPPDAVSTPVKVAGGLRFAAIQPGGGQTCARSFGGLIYCWGENVHGQLGDGTFFPHYTPALTLPIAP